MERLRISFWVTHILSAARMARLAYSIEQQFDGQFNPELNEQDLAFSVAAIYGATSFLEATVNELFRDAAELPGRFEGIAGNLVVDLAHYVHNPSDWRAFRNRKNAAYSAAGTYGNEILNKFQFAAVSLGRPELIETDATFTDARLLIDTRNKLTHFEPETVAVHDSEGPVTMQAISQRLTGRFSTNPFSAAGGHSVFPNLYLSHGACEWAVETAFNFADVFFDHVNLPKIYDVHVRSGCKTR